MFAVLIVVLNHILSVGFIGSWFEFFDRDVFVQVTILEKSKQLINIKLVRKWSKSNNSSKLRKLKKSIK